MLDLFQRCEPATAATDSRMHLATTAGEAKFDSLHDKGRVRNRAPEISANIQSANKVSTIGHSGANRPSHLATSVWSTSRIL